jgi:hypothetical protein
MELSIRIRDTGVRATQILELLAAGNSPEQIVRQIPKVTLSDILGVLQLAHDILANHVSPDDEITLTSSIILRAMSGRVIDVSKVREAYPRAYEKWSPAEDTELVNLFKNRTHIEDIATRLKRQPGAVTARLIKLGHIKASSRTEPRD